MTVEMADGRVGAALGEARRAFLEHVEERRLRLFRLWMQASVARASPLAISVAGHLGLGLEDILGVMGPPPFWPPSTGSMAPPHREWSLRDRVVNRHGDVRLMWRTIHVGGHAQRIGGDGDWVGWRISGDAIELAARFGPGVLVTSKGVLRLWVPGSLPETIRAAMPGRLLAALVDHPFLKEDFLRVVAVEDRVGGQILRVRTGQRPFSAPWPARLADAMMTHAEPSMAARYFEEV